MTPAEVWSVNALTSGVRLMLQGSLPDALEALESIAPPEGGPIPELVCRLKELAKLLIDEFVAKESALATVQSVAWELEATQERLQRSETRYHTTLASIGDGVISTDSNGRVDFMNPVAERLTGWAVVDGRGRPIADVFDIVHSQSRTRVENPTVQCLREGVVVGLENHALLLSRDGMERQIADSCAPIRDSEEQIQGAVLVFRDVSDEYRRRERLRSSEERYRNLVEATSDWIWETDAQGVYTFASTQVETILGYSPGEVVGRSPFDFMCEQEAQRVARVFGEVVASHAPICAMENTSLSKDGRQVILETSGVPFFSPDGVLLGYRGIDRDITRRRRAETALRESEARFRALFEGAGEGILVADAESGAILYANRIWCDMFGYAPEEAATSVGVGDICPEPEDGSVGRPVGVGPRESGIVREFACRTREGTAFWADVRTTSLILNGNPCQVKFYADATARHQYEESLRAEKSLRESAEVELRHAQKLQAVGQLAAGIAHEINTPTQYVGDSVHFLSSSFQELENVVSAFRQIVQQKASLDSRQTLLEAMGEAADAADLSYILENAPGAFSRALDGLSRISSIVSAMKEFAHPDQRDKKPEDLNRALQATLTIARNEYKYVAEVETDFGPLPPVVCHLGELNQVFLNLLVNAAHAIADAGYPEGRHGTIGVRTRVQGDEVHIAVSDNGCGIPEGIRNRIYDPFFTTKEVGRGSGQGLAIAHAVVVEKHGGRISFETALGKGTTFTVVLPLEGSLAAGETRSELSAPPPKSTRTHVPSSDSTLGKPSD